MAAGLATSLIAQAGWGLDDLPPIPKDYVRLFLCRHGQTENNRLGLIQGARVDPPLNERGRLQAERLGKAWESMDLVLHSPLRRARETATIASQQLASQPKLEQLPSLAEVDFGSVLEGSPVEKHRAAMVRTYGAWAVGDLDARLDDGESGYEVMQRVEQTLNSVVNISKDRRVDEMAAVAHSTYIRMLLAVVQDVPLAQASTLEQKNCCINVIDLPTNGVSRSVNGNSAVFGGLISRCPVDYMFSVPAARVVKVNEKRHLDGLL